MTVSSEMSTAFINECSSISTNTQDFSTKSQATVFPNPTNSEVFININGATITDNDYINLYSMIGTQLNSSKINSLQTKIDLSTYPNGIYFLLTTINGGATRFKILKE